ncbi:ABC transporter permease [Limibacter armeniacum]|uniref:ABC transporter permease n=1 Tax=Limibacter armeniacum TaxID=466084 RepID=UPI002FE61E5C
MPKLSSGILKSVFLVLAVLPVAIGLGFALLYSLGIIGVLSEGFTLSYWEEVLLGGTFLKSLAYSFYIGIVTITVSLSVAFWLVLYFKESLTRGVTGYLMFLPLSIPAVVTGFFIFQLLTKSGMLSRVFHYLGWIDTLEQFPELVQDDWGVGIILAHSLMAIPFFTLLLNSIYHDQHLDQLKEVAQTLGGNQQTFLIKIGVPLMLRTASPNILLYLLFVVGAYEVPLLVGSQRIQMVSVLAVRKFQRFNLHDIPEGYAISVAFTVLLLGCIWGLVKLNKKHV